MPRIIAPDVSVDSIVVIAYIVACDRLQHADTPAARLEPTGPGLLEDLDKGHYFG